MVDNAVSNKKSKAFNRKAMKLSKKSLCKLAHNLDYDHSEKGWAISISAKVYIISEI